MSEPKLAPMTITPEEIPDKLYFRIGEVARLAGIKPYVLRFWETEFPALDPKKSGTGHRLYRRKNVQMVLEIKRLLYEKRYTIEGARKFLETRSKDAAPPPPAVTVAPVEQKEIVEWDEFTGRIEPVEAVESPPPTTEALFVSDAPAFAATVTWIVIAG